MKKTRMHRVGCKNNRTVLLLFKAMATFQTGHCPQWVVLARYKFLLGVYCFIGCLELRVQFHFRTWSRFVEISVFILKFCESQPWILNEMIVITSEYTLNFITGHRLVFRTTQATTTRSRKGVSPLKVCFLWTL